jgi:hypothetical protein
MVREEWRSSDSCPYWVLFGAPAVGTPLCHLLAGDLAPIDLPGTFLSGPWSHEVGAVAPKTPSKNVDTTSRTLPNSHRRLESPGSVLQSSSSVPRPQLRRHSPLQGLGGQVRHQLHPGEGLYFADVGRMRREERVRPGRAEFRPREE